MFQIRPLLATFNNYNTMIRRLSLTNQHPAHGRNGYAVSTDDILHVDCSLETVIEVEVEMEDEAPHTYDHEHDNDRDEQGRHMYMYML